MTRKRTPRPAPEITRGAFPVLNTFLRGYLHQDWTLEYESAREARDAFLEDASAEEREEFARECAIFHERTASLDLDALREALEAAFGTTWWPEDAAEVRDVLRAGGR